MVSIIISAWHDKTKILVNIGFSGIFGRSVLQLLLEGNIFLGMLASQLDLETFRWQLWLLAVHISAYVVVHLK